MYVPRYDNEANALIFIPAEGGPADPVGGERRAFVCGSLQDPDKMRSLIGRAACFAPAIAFGWTWELVAIDGKPTQFMAAAPGDPGRALPGVVWLDLSEAEAAVIDALELADGLRRKVRLDVQIGRRRLPASTFVRK